VVAFSAGGLPTAADDHRSTTTARRVAPDHATDTVIADGDDPTTAVWMATAGFGDVATRMCWVNVRPPPVGVAVTVTAHIDLTTMTSPSAGVNDAVVSAVEAEVVPELSGYAVTRVGTG
jgi:hypothetical protein